jgi:hypothetical protein
MEIVAADPGPQQFELGNRAGVETHLRLPERQLRLADRFEGNVDQAIAQGGIVVGLSGLEQQLCAGRDQRQVGRRAAGGCEVALGAVAAAREQILRERQAQPPGVRTAKRQPL